MPFCSRGCTAELSKRVGDTVGLYTPPSNSQNWSGAPSNSNAWHATALARARPMSAGYAGSPEALPVSLPFAYFSLCESGVTYPAPKPYHKRRPAFAGRRVTPRARSFSFLPLIASRLVQSASSIRATIAVAAHRQRLAAVPSRWSRRDPVAAAEIETHGDVLAVPPFPSLPHLVHCAVSQLRVSSPACALALPSFGISPCAMVLSRCRNSPFRSASGQSSWHCSRILLHRRRPVLAAIRYPVTVIDPRCPRCFVGDPRRPTAWSRITCRA